MIRALLNTFFPRICAGCANVLTKNEDIVCTECLYRLPIIQEQRDAEELIKQQLYGRVPLSRAASLLFYRKNGLSQHLIHQLKYQGDERISTYLGNWLAGRLQNLSWPHDIDIVIPVPLHKNRKRQRGYNQVTGFGKALARNLKTSYDAHILRKSFDTHTQVFKDRFARSALSDSYFSLQNKERITHKHLLLIDDIITTGTTLETCTRSLLKGAPSKISIATMAITA